MIVSRLFWFGAQVEYMVSALWHGFELVLAHERDEGMRYDAVIRVRPDVGVHVSKGIYISAMTPHAWRLVARRQEPRTVLSLPHALTNATSFPLANLSAPCHNTATEFIDNCFWSHPADSAVALVRTWYEQFELLPRCPIHPEFQFLVAAGVANVRVRYASSPGPN